MEIFINNLCEDLDFPESIKRELLIQMKLQIFHYLKTRFKKMLSTFQNILPAENQDLSLDSFDKREEDNFLKKTLNEQKRLNFNLSLN